MDTPTQRRAIRRKFPFLFSQDDVPADKAKIVAKLDLMEMDGWKALEEMTLDELNELQAEAESAVIDVNEYGFVGTSNPHDQTICRAREAIKMQRRKVIDKKYDERAKQDQRRNDIVCAASFINRAVNLLEEAAETEQDPVYCNGLLPRYDYEIDPAAMTDGELDFFINNNHPSLAADSFPDYSTLELLKTPTAKKLAAEVKKHNEAFNQRYEIMRTNYEAARAEQARRRDEAREKAEALAAAKREISFTDTNDVIADLVNRIEELESR